MTAAVAYRSQSALAPKRSTAARQKPRPRLRVLDQVSIRRRARRRNAVLLLFIVVLSGLFLVAFVHARLVESQQELDLMRTQIADLEADKAQIERAVDEASSPSLIVGRATELGMVRAEDPVFLAPVGGSTVEVVSVPVVDAAAEVASGGTATPGVLGSAALGETEDG